MDNTSEMDDLTIAMYRLEGLADESYVVTIRSNWDSSGNMHYLLYNDDTAEKSVYYGIFDWSTNTQSVLKLYQDFSLWP